MNRPITIREAVSSDTPTIIDFQLKMALETENLTLDISTLTMGVQRLMKDPTKGKYYVAESEYGIAGCLMTTFEWSDWRDGTVLWIQSVYVAEEFRGQGIFRALYRYVRDLVDADPMLKGIRLYVEKNNSDAQGVYARLGMNGDHYSVFEWMKN